jgi:tRNA threonylcarbamoyladenosine biosynthesis protein TsaB
LSKPTLALDSALGGCIVAVLNGGESHAQVLETGRDQAAKLMPMVQDVMKEAGVAMADLGLIVTTTGPGSFTGLRIGLSAARALGLALSLPVQGVSTFEAMVKSCKPEGRSLVVLESKRADFYVQAFDAAWNAEDAPQCLLAGDIPTDRIVCGDGIARLRLETGLAFENMVERSLLDPLILAEIGAGIFAANGEKAQKPEPFYMRGADVSVSNKVQRQINNYPVQ